MLKVQCELIHYKKKQSDYYMKLKKNERIVFLESTISWFREEAIKLADNIGKLKKRNAELKHELELERNEK